MSPSVQIILSGTLTFGIPLLLAARELLVLRRGGGGGSWRVEPRPEPPRPLSWHPSLPPQRPPSIDRDPFGGDLLRPAPARPPELV